MLRGLCFKMFQSHTLTTLDFIWAIGAWNTEKVKKYLHAFVFQGMAYLIWLPHMTSIRLVHLPRTMWDRTLHISFRCHKWLAGLGLPLTGLDKMPANSIAMPSPLDIQLTPSPQENQLTPEKDISCSTVGTHHLLIPLYNIWVLSSLIYLFLYKKTIFSPAFEIL